MPNFHFSFPRNARPRSHRHSFHRLFLPTQVETEYAAGVPVTASHTRTKVDHTPCSYSCSFSCNRHMSYCFTRTHLTHTPRSPPHEPQRCSKVDSPDSGAPTLLLCEGVLDDHCLNHRQLLLAPAIVHMLTHLFVRVRRFHQGVAVHQVAEPHERVLR